MKPLTSLVLLCSLAILGCSSSTDPAPAGQGELKVTLIDRPAEYDAVNIVVTEVSAHAADSDSTSGWVVLNNTTRTFDLLVLRNGASAILGDAHLDAGHYTQIRLKLADACTVVVDGQVHPLEVPSGTQSGLKLNHPFDIEPDTRYELTLDFDAARSIHRTGNDRYKLSPVIRVVANRASGAISGTVAPAQSRASVFVLAGADTVSTFADESTGAFLLGALPAGIYTVHIAPRVITYRDTSIPGVSVVAGHDTGVGTVTLSPR